MEYFSITSHIHKTTKQVSDMQIRSADSDSVESHFIVRHQHDNLITTNHPPCCNSNITELFKTATTVILPHFTFFKKFNSLWLGGSMRWKGIRDTYKYHLQHHHHHHLFFTIINTTITTTGFF